MNPETNLAEFSSGWFASLATTQNWRKKQKTRGVSHCGLAIHIKKYLKAKEEFWKLKYFTIHAKIYLIFKKSSKRNQNPSRYYNSIINLKFQHKPKYHLSKILT
jgi:hypothetical protein